MLAVHILEALLHGDFSGAASAAAGALATGARNALGDLSKPFDPRNEIKSTYKEFGRNLWDQVPGAAEWEEVEKRVHELANDVQSFGKEVVSSIADTVGSALGSGELPAQSDGGLGQTHDIFTPKDSNVPNMPMGELPGMGSDAAGTSRASDGGGVGASSGGSAGGSGPAPLGISGSGAGASGAQPPTASDLGIDPNSGAYIEYQPNQGQVKITYPDGSTETRPWPAQ